MLTLQHLPHRLRFLLRAKSVDRKRRTQIQVISYKSVDRSKLGIGIIAQIPFAEKTELT